MEQIKTIFTLKDFLKEIEYVGLSSTLKVRIKNDILNIKKISTQIINSDSLCVLNVNSEEAKNNFTLFDLLCKSEFDSNNLLQASYNGDLFIVKGVEVNIDQGDVIINC